MRYILYIYDDSEAYNKIYVNADTNKLNVVYSKDEEKDRLVGGEVTLIGKDYDFIKTITKRKTDFILYENGVKLASGEVDLQANEDEDFKKITLKLEVKDKYQMFDEKGDELFNITSLDNKKSVYYEVEQMWETTDGSFENVYLETSENIVEGSGTGDWVTGIENLSSVIAKTGYFVVSATVVGSSFSLVTCDTLTASPFNSQPVLKANSVYVEYIRQVAFGYYSGTDKVAPQIDGIWVYLEDRLFGNSTIPVYYNDFENITWDYIPDYNYGFNCNVPIYASVDYAQITIPEPSNIEVSYFETFRKVTDVIEALVNNIDSTILFDDTGTTTDSFYSFNTFTGEDLTRVLHITGSPVNYDLGDKPYENLLISNVTDFIPIYNESLLRWEQKEFPAEISNLSFNRIISYFAEMGFVWYLEERTGGNYFRLIHVLHKSLVSSTKVLPRVSTYKSQFKTPIAPNFSKIYNEKLSLGLDFVGTPAIFENIVLDNTLTLTNNFIFEDSDFIAFEGANNFESTANNNFVIISASENILANTFYGVRDATGLFSGLRNNNSELSFAYLAQKMFKELPDNELSVNGTTVTVEDLRLQKKHSIKLTLPLKYIQYYKLYETISYLTELVEIISVERSGNSNFVELEIIK